jgi:hypothetical protein
MGPPHSKVSVTVCFGWVVGTESTARGSEQQQSSSVRRRILPMPLTLNHVYDTAFTTVREAFSVASECGRGTVLCPRDSGGKSSPTDPNGSGTIDARALRWSIPNLHTWQDSPAAPHRNLRRTTPQTRLQRSTFPRLRSVPRGNSSVATELRWPTALFVAPRGFFWQYFSKGKPSLNQYRATAPSTETSC